MRGLVNLKYRAKDLGRHAHVQPKSDPDENYRSMRRRKRGF